MTILPRCWFWLRSVPVGAWSCYGVVHERIVRGEIVTNGQSLFLLQVDEILRNEPGTRVNVSDADGDTQPQYQLRLTFLTGTTDRKPLEDFATLVNKELSADL